MADTRRIHLPRAGSLRRGLSAPPLRALAAFFFLASPCLAGGLADTATAPDPCLPAATEGMTNEMLRGWRAMLEMKADECGPPPVLLPQFTDREKLEWAFNGSRIPSPVTPVPVPASALMLVAALAMLWRRR